jgi:hypothetical protein
MPTARNNDLFGLGSQQQLTPVSQPEEAPVAAVGNGPGKGAAVHTSTDPAEVRAFLQGSAGASGLNVSKWDTADEELVKRAEVFSRCVTLFSISCLVSSRLLDINITSSCAVVY